MQAVVTSIMFFITAAYCAMTFHGGTGMKRLYQPGDVTLGGLFFLHYTTDDGKCGEFFPIGLGHVEAMIFAVNKINENPNLLPNVTLGYDIRDYCESAAKAMKHTYEFVRRNDIALKPKSDSCSCENETESSYTERTPIAAVIGPTDSGSSVVVGSLLEVAGIPVISHSATSNELSLPQYRHFFRTAPPDSQQASAMADIIEHFNWSYVATVAMDDSYGRNGVRGLETEAEERKTFCIAFAEFIPRQEYSSKLIRTVSKIKSYPNVKVVILWLFGSYGNLFLKEAAKQKLDDRTWILSDGLAAEHDVFVRLKDTDQNIIHGSLGVHPRHLDNRYFINFLIEKATQSSQNNRVPWWEEFWQSQNRVNCSSTPRSNNRTGCQKMIFRSIYDNYIPYVVDAVSAVAHALHHMINCSASKRTTPNEECPFILPFVDPQEIEHFLRTVDFPGLTGRVRFDSVGDPVLSSYDIVHFQHSNTLSEHRQPVKIITGSWKKDRKPRLILNCTGIKWNTQVSQNSTPKSFCHDDCLQGTFRSLTTPCCWECIKCPAGTVSSGLNSVNCTECPKGQKTNERRSNCLDLPEDEMMWSRLTPVLVILLATVGVIVIIICSAFFYKYRNTPLVKAANWELSCILMITIALSFSVSILTLAKPTNFTCSLDVAWRSTLLVTFVAVLILKTMKILGAFRINLIAERLKRFILVAKCQTGLLSFQKFYSSCYG